MRPQRVHRQAQLGDAVEQRLQSREVRQDAPKERVRATCTSLPGTGPQGALPDGQALPRDSASADGHSGIVLCNAMPQPLTLESRIRVTGVTTECERKARVCRGKLECLAASTLSDSDK
jgi:hypothetical protein